MTKIEKLCIKWLNDNYNPMEPFIMEEYPYYIFHMKDGRCILQYNKKNGYVYVSYKEIWKFFELYFSMSNEQIKDITKIWVEEHYKMDVTKTDINYSSCYSSHYQRWKQVEEHYKAGVTTTSFWNGSAVYRVEEHYKAGVTTTHQMSFDTHKMVEEHYKAGVTTTEVSLFTDLDTVEEQYKMGVKSTMVDYKEITNQVEEQYKQI